jgi:hypothetical protein
MGSRFFQTIGNIGAAAGTLISFAASGVSAVSPAYAVSATRPGQDGSRAGAAGGCFVNGKWYPEGATVPLPFDFSHSWVIVVPAGICRDGLICTGPGCFNYHR